MSDEHPAHLLWFAAGKLDEAQAADTRRHLDTCASCRREVADLRRLGDAMLADPHVPPELLADYAEGLEQRAARQRRGIEAHLAECAPCRADLGLVAQPGAGRPRVLRANPWKLGFIAAASLLVGTLVFDGLPWIEPDPGILPLTAETLAPARRGAVPDEGVLRGRGPWAVTVLLPSTADLDRYVVTLREAGGQTVQAVADPVLAERTRGLTLFVPGSLPSGKYVFRLQAPSGSGPFDYPFEVRNGHPDDAAR